MASLFPENSSDVDDMDDDEFMMDCAFDLEDDDDDGNDEVSDIFGLTMLCGGGTEPEKEKRGRPTGSTKKLLEDDRPVKKAKLDLLPIERIISFLCCSLLCLSYIPIQSLKKSRDMFNALSSTKRSQWILEWLQSHTRDDNTTTFSISGYNVCLSAWCMCYGISLSTYYNLRHKFISGITQITGSGNVQGKLNMKSQFALSWLTVFAQSHADKMPDSTKMHLPCCLSKTAVFDMMIDDGKTRGEESISMRHFFRLWKRFLPHIVIPKRSRFSICDVCNKLKTKINTTTDKKMREVLTGLRDQHLRQQNQERQKYYKHATKGKQDRGYLSIIIDGMDQDKTNIPHLTETPKSLSNGWRLKMNLMAAIVHGVGIYGFFDASQWSHGSSYTISVLVHILSMMVDTIPDTLYLQLDNCPGQNKNRFMLGFLATLVQFGIFKKIKLSFLMVGHTHEDIDQVFSRYSVWLNRHNAFTLPALIDGFENCYSPRPTGIQMHEVYNFGSYLNMNDIINHSKPHVYKIIQVDGVATIYYKKWSTDKEWTQCEGECLLRDFAIDRPVNLISPSTKDLNEKIELDVLAVAKFYKDNELEMWWQDFFCSLKEQEDSWTEQNRSIMEELLAKKKERPTENPDDVNNMADMMASLNLPGINNPLPPVVIGKKKNNNRKGQSEGEPQLGQLVFIDMLKYCDEWPQVAKIISIDLDSYTVHWFKGSKTTSWTPATRRVKGAKGGKREPCIETVNRCVIWHHGFRLTPAGMLGKSEKEVLDRYFE